MDTGIHPKAVLVLVLASYTMIVLDISIVITALPKIHHTLGFSATALCLGILVAVFAAAGSSTLHGPELLAHRIAAALTVGAGMLALALIVAHAVRPRMTAGAPARAPMGSSPRAAAAAVTEPADRTPAGRPAVSTDR
jgi:hypothetical protein